MIKIAPILLGVIITAIIIMAAWLGRTLFAPTEAASSPIFIPIEIAAPPTNTLPGGAVSEISLLNRGKLLYTQDCSGCHGPAGEGSAIAPPINSAELRARLDNTALAATISNGRPNTQMPAWGGVLSQADIAALVALIRGWDNLSQTEVSQMAEQAPRKGPGWLEMGPGMMNDQGSMGHSGGMGHGMMGGQGGGGMMGGR